MMALEAHRQGFSVLEREEIERRLLFKSENYEKTASMKNMLHLNNPAPQIVGTSLLGLISCLSIDSTNANSVMNTNPFLVFNKTAISFIK